MSTATFTVGPGESYRIKSTGTVVILGPNQIPVVRESQFYEKIHTGGGTSNFGKVTIGDLHVGNHDARVFNLDDWESARHLFYNPGDPKTDIPAFVEPERPVEPKPEPDSPAVAVLRRLLEDREARVRKYEAETEDLDSRIEDLETQLQAIRAEACHKERCAEACHNEATEIRANIVALGGEV